MPAAIEKIGTVTKHFEKWIDLDLKIEASQKPCLLGTARIIWKVLNMKRKKNDTIPNCIASGWCSLLCSFYQEITSDLRV